jgi:lipoprotein-anchoring transpeptidase ErfK/SrfK
VIYLKKILLILLTVVLSLVIVGCTDDTASASKASEQVNAAATEQVVEAEKQAAEIAAAKAAEAKAAEEARLAAEKAAKEKAEAEQKSEQPIVIADGSYFITINLSTNKLTLFNGSEVAAVYSVATGKLVNGVSLTPTGKFTILTKVREPAWGGGGYTDPIAGGDPNNPLGHYWMGLSAGSNPGSEYGIHGNIDENSIGTYASHGCIRMHNYEVPILFNTVPKGTKVWIGSSSQLTNWGVMGFN